LLLVLIAGSSLLLRHVPILKSKPKPPPIEPMQIRLEIINASGIDKQGKRAMDYLRKIGFDVYGVKTGLKEIEQTTILDRVDIGMKNAKTTAELLAIKKKVIFFLPWSKELIPAIDCDIDSTLYLEVTVVLGKDCQQFIPKTVIVF
jgi:hypothetical protein